MDVGVNVTAAAIVGVTVLLVSGVLTWDECLSNKSAWNTFTWFAAVIAFATQLKALGFVSSLPQPKCERFNCIMSSIWLGLVLACPPTC